MLTPGIAAPEFTLPGLDGGTISLDCGSRLPVLLAFYKVTCPVCQYAFPFIDRIASSAKGLRVAGISQDDAKATAAFCRAYDLHFPMALDSTKAGYPVSNAYRITHVPSIFLVENGEITMSVSGFSRADLEQIGARFNAPPFRKGENIPEFRPG
jgi:peroxiredoxin